MGVNGVDPTKQFRRKKDVIEYAEKFADKEGEFTTNKLMEQIKEKNLISKAPFHIKFKLRGLISILQSSNKFTWENKYSKDYGRVLRHWKLKK